MLFTKPTLAAKQRVRTGCLTCRKRRRKCDERKPCCENCKEKGLSCRYGTDLTFISASNSGSQQPHGAPNVNVQAYSTITFVDNNDTPAASTPPGSDERSLYQHTPARDVETIDTIRLDADVTRSFITRPRLLHARRDTVHHGSAEQATQQNGETIPAFTLDRAPDQAYPEIHLSDGMVDRRTLANSNQETMLLRHFRYNLSPWIDVGDPEFSFGIKIMLLSKVSRALFAAILTLAARHKSLVYLEQDSDNLKSSLKYREEAEQGLTFEETFVNRTGKILLMLGDFLSSSPLQWRDMLYHHIGIPDNLESLAALEEESSQSLFWLYFRFDLASSIISTRPPQMPFPSHVLNQESPSISCQSQKQSTKQAHQQSLLLLANCLSLIFGHGNTSSLRLEKADMTNFGAIRNPSLSSRWTFWWNKCQKWYNDRPVEVQQVLDIRGVDVEQIYHQTSSTFPILIYTTPLALVSNAVYHITSLLLLTHKPRLLKGLVGPRCFTSHNWHAQSIAGIATSNELFEQWDPVMIAGLLLTAREMTHESQQSVLLDQLGMVTSMTGIKLDREVEILKSGWSISRYDEKI